MTAILLLLPIAAWLCLIFLIVQRSQTVTQNIALPPFSDPDMQSSAFFFLYILAGCFLMLLIIFCPKRGMSFFYVSELALKSSVRADNDGEKME